MQRVYLIILFALMLMVGILILHSGKSTQPSPAVLQTPWNIDANMVIGFTFALAYIFIWVWEAVVRRFSDRDFMIKFIIASSAIMAVVMWAFAVVPGVI